VFPKGYPTCLRTVGDHLRRRRLEAGLTQRTLAERWGVRTETVANWELGRTRPLVRQIAKILALVGVDPEASPDTLSGRLLAVRRRLGLTQAELAARLGQDEHQICRWEGGRQKPHPGIASRIDLGLRALEGRPVDDADAPLSFFDLTRWRRKLPAGVTLTPQTFGERLRARRLELGLSMREVAGRAGVSRGTIYCLEADRQRPSVTVAGALGHVLAVNVTGALGGGTGAGEAREGPTQGRSLG
jgi:transcriptional regulator with XRE-family HTH domain